VFYPDESFIFPHLYLAAVLRAARACGAELRFDAEVVDLVVAGGRACGVDLRTGESLSADVVLCCCGRWTPRVLRLVDVELPLVSPDVPGSGAVARLVRPTPGVAAAQRVLPPPGLAVRPQGGGHLLLHGAAFDTAVTAETPLWPPPPAALQLLEAVRPLVRY